jgi:ribosomal protein S18 acetylase RimI-like enzyme
MKNHMQYIRKALLSDSESISRLVNLAYRGESSRAGWTTEADILDGLRTNPEEVRNIIESGDKVILLCLDNSELLGSVCIELDKDVVRFGMLAVNPTKQANGIGKRLLAKAEELAQQISGVKKFQMHVIAIRHELIAFYERRGYVRTGTLIDFPANPSVWQPKIDGLQLVTFEKISHELE